MTQLCPMPNVARLAAPAGRRSIFAPLAARLSSMKETTVVHSGNAAIEFYWRLPQVGVMSLKHKAEQMLRDMVRENKETARKFLRAIDCNIAN